MHDYKLKTSQKINLLRVKYDAAMLSVLVAIGFFH